MARIEPIKYENMTAEAKSAHDEYAKKAKSLGCQLALYGHTHQAGVVDIDGVTLVNPGSLRYSFNEGGSYAYIVINGEKITAVIVGESVG